MDVTDWLTAYASFGYHDSNINYKYPSPIISNTTGLWAACGRIRSPEARSFETYAGEAGLRANVDAGPVNHAVNVNYSINDRTYTRWPGVRRAECDLLEPLQ